MPTTSTPLHGLQRHIDFDFLANSHLLERPDKNALGHDMTGRYDFLSLIEGQLGFTTPTFVQRLLDCERYLQQILADNHSVWHSFHKNSVSTARVLLQWFDGLTLIGWRGEALHEVDNKPERLQRFAPMSMLYQRAQEDDSALLCSEALRIERCCEALQHNAVQITSIRVQQPIELLPAIWRQLFNQLEASGVVIEQSELARLDGFDGEALKQQVAVVSCKGPLAASRISAQLLSAAKAQWNQSTNLVVSDDGVLSDQAMHHAGLPSVGFQQTQQSRHLGQIIPALVTLFSGRYSVQSLVALLTHPAWPGNKALANKAAKTLTNGQGFDTDNWREAADAIANDTPQHGVWLSYFEKPLLADEAQATEVLAQILSEVKTKSQGKAFVFSQQGAEVESAAYSAFAYDIEVLSELVAQQVAIDRLPLYIRDLGLGDFDVPARKGTLVGGRRLQGMTEPGQLALQPRLTCWIGPYFNDFAILPDWYRTEQQALSERFEFYPNINALMLQQHAWASFARATLSDSQQRMLIVHYDEERVTHPLYDQFIEEGKLQVATWASVSDAPWLDWLNPDAITNDYGIAPLYAHARRAQLSQPIDLSKQMSASRLEKLIFKPSDFVFSHIARLKPAQLDLEGVSNKLKGSFAHQVFEHFFREYPTPDLWKNVDVAQWFDSNADALLEQYAVVYLEPGASYEATAMKAMSKEALLNLVDTITEAGGVHVHPEYSLSGMLLTIAGRHFELSGSIDLLIEVEREGHRRYVVLDAKLNSPQKNGKQAELEAGLALQLYVYAAAVYENFGQWPDIGYFIISRNQYLMADNNADAWPGATRVQTPDSAALSWQKYNDLAKWRFEQFERGELEINDLRSERIGELSEPLDDALAVIMSAYFDLKQKEPMKKEKRDAYSDFKYLTGWRSVTEQGE